MQPALATKRTQNPTDDSVSYSQNNPAEDHVVSNDDDVWYDVNNSYESASDLCGDLAVNAAMGDKKKITQQRIVRQMIEWQALATKRTPQRIVRAILKTTHQRIMSRAILMMLCMKSTILMN